MRDGMLQVDLEIRWAGAGPVRFPSIPVPVGAVVEVRPIADNTKTVYVGKGVNEAQSGPRASFAPTSASEFYNVRNLQELFVFGSVNNEGVSVAMRRSANRATDYDDSAAGVAVQLSRPQRPTRA